MKKFLRFENINYIIIILFFLSIAFFYPAGIYDDTNSYIILSSDRDPLYGIFLWLISLVSTNNMMHIAVIIQNLFLICSSIYLLNTLKNIFKLSRFMQFLITFCIIVPHVLTHLGSTSGLWLSNSILSEGICIPLYILFFALLLRSIMMEMHKMINKYTLLSLTIAILISLGRGQLMSILVAWFIIMIIKSIYIKRARYIFALSLLFLLSFGIKSGINGLYNYLANGVFAGNTSQSATQLSNALFMVDLSDEIKFDDPDIQNIYDEIKERLINNKLNIQYAPDNIIDFVEYYEYSHDEIKFNQIVLPIHMYVRENGHETPIDTTINCDKTAEIIYQRIVMENIGNTIKTYFYIVLSGFVRTNSIFYPIFIIYSILLYLLSIALLIILLRKYANKKGTMPAVIMMLVVDLLIAGVVFSTALFTMCISRYMIYNMTLFYIAVLIMVNQFINMNRIKEKSGENIN